MTAHPFISIQEADEKGFLANPPPQVHMLSTQFVNGRASISFARVPPQQAFASFEEAESHVLDHFIKHSLTLTTENLNGALGYVIMRASQKVAMSTRRAPANRVLLHPDGLEDFVTACNAVTGAMFAPVAGGATVGRCTHVGLLANSLDVWVHPEVPQGSHVTLYSGRTGDGPAVVMNTHLGWQLAMQPQGSQAESKDYAVVVK